MPIAPAPYLDANVGPIWFCPLATESLYASQHFYLPEAFQSEVADRSGGLARTIDHWRSPVQQALDAFQRLLSQAGEARYDIPGQALAALGDLLTVPARLAGYQDCFSIIGLGFLLALLPAWWSRLQRPRPRPERRWSQAEPVVQVQTEPAVAR